MTDQTTSRRSAVYLGDSAGGYPTDLPSALRAEAREWDDPTMPEQACVDLMRGAANAIECLRAKTTPANAETVAYYAEREIADLQERNVALLKAGLLRMDLEKHTHPVPSTKGMGPADRANRLHAELERRIAIAKKALNHVAG